MYNKQAYNTEKRGGTATVHIAL